MSDPSNIKFAIRDETRESGNLVFIWAALNWPQIEGEAPLVCAAAESKAQAEEEYDLWLSTYLATNRNHRAALDALWGLKFGRVA